MRRRIKQHPSCHLASFLSHSVSVTRCTHFTESQFHWLTHSMATKLKRIQKCHFDALTTAHLTHSRCQHKKQFGHMCILPIIILCSELQKSTLTVNCFDDQTQNVNFSPSTDWASKYSSLYEKISARWNGKMSTEMISPPSYVCVASS